MKANIKNYIKNCHNCQLGKRGLKGYGKISLKDIEMIDDKEQVEVLYYLKPE